VPALVDYGTSSGAGFSCVFAGACCDSADAEMIRGLERTAAPPLSTIPPEDLSEEPSGAENTSVCRRTVEQLQQQRTGGKDMMDSR